MESKTTQVDVPTKYKKNIGFSRGGSWQKFKPLKNMHKKPAMLAYLKKKDIKAQKIFKI